MNVCSKKILLTLLGLLSLTACNVAPNKIRGAGTRSSVLPPGHAYLMLQSPSDQNSSATLPVKVEEFISFEPQLVTPKSYLGYDCQFENETSNDCIRILKTPESSSPISRTDENWGVDVQSEDFLQVQTMYHAKEMIEKFYGFLDFALDFHRPRVSSASIVNPLAIAPATPLSISSIWLESSQAPNFDVSNLNIAMFCPEENGLPLIAYLPAHRRICLGNESWFKENKFHFSQDPETIYHELSHVLIEIMTNLRNTTSPIKTDLGFLSYDEAFSINEGIADYLTYTMTGNSRQYVWSLGVALPALGFGNASRPVSESDPLHISAISQDDNSRLSYPQYITYSPSSPQEIIEDVHSTGSIVSHYLVSLTQDLQSTCSTTDANKAQSMVMTIIIETLAELGDLTSRGSDLNNLAGTYFANFNADNSYDWIKTTRTVNLQRFMQTFAKYGYHYISNDMCPAYTKNLLEQNLDKYGFLLFNDYQDHGLDSTGTVSIQTATTVVIPPSSNPTPIEILNRTKTTLIAHSQISLPTNEEIRPNVFLIDSIEGAQNLLKSHYFQGNPLDLTLSDELSGTRYNNDNRFFNPGEVLGFSLNLVNDSNVPLAGVQILGNNWDHYKQDPVDPTGYPKICSFDGFPGASEGGITDTATPAAGDCQYANRSSGSSLDQMQPVCFVQQVDNDGNQEWITQDEFRQNPTLALSQSQCLGPQGEQNPNECLARIVPGGDHTFFSKIDPNKTWAETIYANTANPKLNSSGFMIMEINKLVPAGTLFNCRFRVRFSNCSDCHTDQATNNSYNEFEYNSQKPYKLINFQFRVQN